MIKPETEVKLLLHSKKELVSSVLRFKEDVSGPFRQFLVFSLELEGWIDWNLPYTFKI